jgi:hypothetical protein
MANPVMAKAKVQKLVSSAAGSASAESYLARRVAYNILP